jgi:hypothetical protein
MAIEVSDFKSHDVSNTLARIFTPGAMMSDFKMPRLHLLEPLPEKLATMGV